jgi:hypothetical protein
MSIRYRIDYVEMRGVKKLYTRRFASGLQWSVRQNRTSVCEKIPVNHFEWLMAHDPLLDRGGRGRISSRFREVG